MEHTSEQLVKQPEKGTCPHLGSEYQPFVNPQLDDPYSFYKRARKEEPLFYSPQLNAYVLTRYDDILSVLKDPERFSSVDTLRPTVHFTPEVLQVLAQGYLPVPTAFNSDGDTHKRFREPMNRAFAPARLGVMEDSIRAIANKLVDGFINNGSAEIISEFANPLPLEVILTMYGVPVEKMAQMKKWCDDQMALFHFSHLTLERQIEYARSIVAMQHTIAGLIEERKLAPRNDFISDIQTADFNMNELVVVLCRTILAGHETTTHLISNALKVLLEGPQLWQALCNDPSLIPAAIEEVLRYDDPVPSIIRTTTQEVELAGVTLPKGTQIFLMYASGNRDETQYSDAEHFQLGRFKQAPVNHLGFGNGIHYCVGASLARREARIALETLSKRLPNLRLRPNQQLAHIPSLLFRGFTHLDVEWDVA